MASAALQTKADTRQARVQCLLDRGATCITDTSCAFGIPGVAPPLVTVDPFFDSVELLLHLDETVTLTPPVDSSQRARVTTVGVGTLADTTIKRHGAAALDMNDSIVGNVTVSDLVKSGEAGAPLAFEAAEFTVEGWLRFSALSAARDDLWLTTGSLTWGCHLTETSITVEFSANGSGYNGTFTNTFPFAVDQWYNIAFCRDAAGNIWVYVAGVCINLESGDSYGGTIFLPTSGSPKLVLGGNVTNPLNGHVDDWRITKGVCRYPDGDTYAVLNQAFPD